MENTRTDNVRENRIVEQTMKITIETLEPDAEEEIIIRCRTLDDDLMDLIYALKARRGKLTAYSSQGIVILSVKDVYYFESVDNKVFAYCRTEVYEVHKKLYELEEELNSQDFLRVSKSIIVHLPKISYLRPLFNGRFEATLKNAEKILVSRRYVAEMKKKLGI